MDVQICDKDSNRSHPHGAQPHDSKVLAHAVWGLEVLCCRSGHQQADSPKEPGAAEPRERRDQQAAASGTTKPARGTPGCTARPVHHPGPADRRLRPACVPAGRKGTARFAAGSQGSDLPTSRRSGRAQSASPPAHRAQTYRHPAVESSVGHVSRPGAARPARVSEAMTLKRLRSEETRQTPSFCPGVPRPRAVRRPPWGYSRH